KSVHGASTFTLGQNRTKENFEIAKRENSVILLEENYEKRYEGFDPNSAESYIMFEFMQDNYMNQSIKFASEIQKRFKDSGRIDRGVRQDVFLVLRHTSMPSVLVELGFLTNPDEELFLKSDAGKDQQAESLLKAFTDFKNDYDRKSGVKLISDMPANSKNRKSTQRNSVQDSNSTHNTAQPEKIESELEEIANHTNKSGIDFRIQLVSSSTKIPKNDERLKGYQLDYYYEKGYYKYTYGSFSTFSEANKKRRELSASFPEAFVIAFRNGQRMPVNEARNLLSK
ncbi:MAG: N-acetylmuramoyl-L-alanine amidase, partial [Bacteroidota bacterium]|nr:N-acetylmuramoyl-L-alanine amidase [Bacteroidota bacterium]